MDTTDSRPTKVENQNPLAAETSLCWSIHLMRRHPHRFPILILTLCIAAGLVWELFHTPLPVFAAIGLLLFAATDYLLPIRYRLTASGVSCRCGLSRTALQWEAVRRCQISRTTMRLSPLAASSRLDAFRGITVRFALDGEPGDRASVLALTAQSALQIGASIERALLLVDKAAVDAGTSILSHPYSTDVMNESVSTL